VRLLLERLRSTGRSRLAIITRHDQHGDYEALLRELLPAAAAAGVETRASWHLGVATDSPVFTRNLVQLLFEGNQASRPDVIYVTDDTVLPAVASALTAAGLRAPADVELVAHANFPYLPESVLPVWRFGVDAQEVLDRATAVIDARRRGESVAYCQPVSICTEDEWRTRRYERTS
jgi:DNA-binding LacI/PurR family transcriptional regulator